MSETESARTIVLIDGTSFVFRAYHAIHSLSNRQGIPTNAVYGFTSMLLGLLGKYGDQFFSVVFDAPGPSFRDEIYPDYKATRPAPPEDLHQQVAYIHQVVQGLGVPMLVIQGYEADDVIGTLASQARDQGLKVIIISSDKDLMQLVEADVKMHDTLQDRWYGPEEVEAKLGVPPRLVPDWLGLAGDSSDNIPGVRGIGPKTATVLLQAYGSLEGVYDHVEEITQPKRRESLKACRDIAFLSRDLATIRKDVPLDQRPQDCTIGQKNDNVLHDLFKKLEFHAFMKLLAPRESVSREDYMTVRTEEDLARVIDEIRAAGLVSLDLETTSIDPMRAEVVGVALCSHDSVAYYIPLAHSMDPEPQLERALALQTLKPLLEDPAIAKLGQNSKYEHVVLAEAGIDLRGVSFDAMLASYLLDPSRFRHNLENIARDFLDHEMISYTQVTREGGKEIPFAQVPVQQATRYAAEDAHVVWLLWQKMVPQLEKNDLCPIMNDIELPLSRVLALMERRGVLVNTDVLKSLTHQFNQDLMRLGTEIQTMAGQTFNILSPKQLANVLFDRLKLPIKKKTKSGASTDQSVLEELSELHPLPALVLEYRSLSKLKGTYTETLGELINPKTGRIHTSYNQAVAATGRLSSSDPNLQNIPIRTEMGRKIRDAFYAPPGWLLLGADYSQIELRVLAHLCGEERMVSAFLEGVDIHTRTAAEIFKVPLEEVTRDQRRAAKAINFGIIYGMGANRLAREIQVTKAQAQSYIDDYFARLGGVKAYMDQILVDARERGYVSTLLGRRRYLNDLRSKNHKIRSMSERMAINTPIQGSAADIIKKAMIRCLDRIERDDFNAWMVMQVHDELVFEVPEGELEALSVAMKEEMESVMTLKVPLAVDLKWGKTWNF